MYRERILENFPEAWDSWDSWDNTPEDVPAAKRLIEAALALMPDDPALEERMWASNIGVVCFTNGLFRRRAFFRYEDRPDVMPRLCVPRDFPVQRPPDALLDEVRERLLMSTLGDAEVHRCIGGSVHRCIGGSVHRWIGASVHRCIGDAPPTRPMSEVVKVLAGGHRTRCERRDGGSTDRCMRKVRRSEKVGHAGPGRWSPCPIVSVSP